MAGNRTIPQKTNDWTQVFNVIRSELTPEPMRKLMGIMNIGEATTPEEAVKVLQTSMALARYIGANDRAAAIAAAMLTSGGGARVALPVEDLGDEH